MLNNRGMSLVSVLMAIGMTGILAMILMNLMEKQSKQQKKALIDGELNEVYAQFVRIINQKNSCGSTFIGLQKGDSFQEFRYTFDPNQEPFAEVGKNFRGTKLVLSEMKILTDSEVTQRNLVPLQKDSSGFTTAVLEITLDKPEGTLGGSKAKKIFDVPVAIGKGSIIKMADPNAIVVKCSQMSGGDGCIADFDSGVCPSNPNNAMVGGGSFWFGYCFDPTPSSTADDIIVRCTSVN